VAAGGGRHAWRRAEDARTAAAAACGGRRECEIVRGGDGRDEIPFF